jgi:hypothetical protein
MHRFFFAVLFLSLLGVRSLGIETKDPFGWNEMPSTAYPGAYWWWLGSAVNEQELDHEIQSLSEVGIKTLRLDAIYKGEGSSIPTRDYLSDGWNAAANQAAVLCASYGVQLDLWGNGWPLGGNWIEPEHASRRLEWDDGLSGRILEETLTIEQDEGYPILSVMVTPPSASGTEAAQVLPARTREGKQVWSVPPGKWDIHVFRNGFTRMEVKRAPPGGEGPVMDHYSQEALEDCLAPYDRLLESMGDRHFSVIHNDSFEVYKANWTPGFLPFFSEKRGYDLTRYLPALISGSDSQLAQRIRHDYRETIQEILTERMMEPWVEWAHRHGMKTSYQAHGSPGHLVDLYGLSDQPDTEAFGRPGMANHGGDHEGSGYMCSKFASSAAHLRSRPFTSSESFTWLEDHFCVSLDRMRREIDYYFLAGINRMYFHSTTFSPSDVPFPGWLYYASTNVDDCQTWWKHLRHLNDYIARAQTVLQQGDPGEDLLLLYPIHDLWFDNENAIDLLQYCRVHNTANWLHRAAKPTQETAQFLWNEGWKFDWCSDSIITDLLRVEDGAIVCGEGRYRALIIPECNWVGADTPETLRRLAKQGAQIVFVGRPPQPVPTEAPEKERARLAEEPRWEVYGGDPLPSNIHPVKDLESLGSTLESTGAIRETMAKMGLLSIRRKTETGYSYFVLNTNAKSFEDWLPVSGLSPELEVGSVIVGDPISGKTRIVPTRKSERCLEAWVNIPAGRSLVIRSIETPLDLGPENAVNASSTETLQIEGPWRIAWQDLEKPAEIHRMELEALKSWTNFEELKHFSGTVTYEVEFDLSEVHRDWLLDLGELHESADVFLNGERVGCAWTSPYAVAVGEHCHVGQNNLRIEVVNLTANRIIGLEKSGGHLKDRHLFVNYDYKPFDAETWEPLISGLIGPVRLTLRP